MTHICVGNLTTFGSDNGLSPGRPLSEPMLESVNLTLMNKHRWNFNRESFIFIQENALEAVVYEMAAILSRPQCVNMISWSITSTLKRKCRHFDEIFITGCTGSCHFDDFQCSQWWKFHQNEDISVSVEFNLLNRGSYIYNCKPGVKLD